jgi:hypothetical protein
MAAMAASAASRLARCRLGWGAVAAETARRGLPVRWRPIGASTAGRGGSKALRGGSGLAAGMEGEGQRDARAGQPSRVSRLASAGRRRSCRLAASGGAGSGRLHCVAGSK